MKNFKVLLLTLALTSNHAGAAQKTNNLPQTTNPPPTVKSVDEALNGQLGVTSDALTQILNEIKNAKSNASPISNADFVAAANEFNARAEKAMADFEIYMEKDLLTKVKFYLDRLESIRSSTMYTPEQKVALINDTRYGVQIEFYNLAKTYRAELYKLLTLGLPDASDGSVERSYLKVTIPSLGLKEVAVWQYRDPDNNFFGPGGMFGKMPYMAVLHVDRSLYNDNTDTAGVKTVRDAVFKKSILDKCKSSTCVVLLSGHILFYMRTVKDRLNKVLTFENLEICGFNRCQTNSEWEGHFFTGFLNQLPYYVTPNPGETLGMPFDATEAEARAKANPSSAPTGAKEPKEEPKKKWWQ